MNNIEKLKLKRLSKELKRLFSEKQKCIKNQDYDGAAHFRDKEKNILDTNNLEYNNFELIKKNKN